MGHHLNTATFKLRSNESDLAKKKCSFLYYFFFMDASIFDSIGVIISIRKSSVTADGKQQCSCRDLDVNKRLGAHLNTATFKLRSNESDLAKKNAVFCTTFFFMDASIFDSIGVIISIRKSSVTADGKQQCSCRDLDVNKRLGAHLNTATFKLRSNESDLAKKNAVFCTTLFLWMFLLWRAVARW